MTKSIIDIVNQVAVIAGADFLQDVRKTILKCSELILPVTVLDTKLACL